MTLTVTDLFCGAGGSSSGLEDIPGVTVRMAANHWPLAVETHNTNLPHALHDTADISQVDPRRYPRTDILWASPECTNHSQARGKRRHDNQPDLFGETLPDEASERSRATMWDVVRFAEHHRYRAVIVENVVDAYHWAPFHAWLAAMDSLGYEHQLVWLNSMHAHAAGMPAPQSRDRLYIVFWRKGDRRPDIDKWTRPRAWCPRCDELVTAVQVFKRQDRPAWGRYRAQYVYRCPAARCGTVVEPAWLPAAAAIDWTLPGERIGDRARPLAEKTRRRIEAGLRKYARPIQVDAAGNTYDAADPNYRGGVSYYRAWPIDEVLRTLHTTASKGVAYPPMLVPAGGTWNDDPTSVIDAMRTRTTRATEALVVPVEGREGLSARSSDEPLRTQTARNQDAVAIAPLIMRPYTPRGDGGLGGQMLTPVDETMRALTASAVPSLIVPLRQHNTAKSTGDPLDTVAAAGNHHALVMRNNGSRGDGGEHCTTVDDVLRTLTTAGHQSLVQWDRLLIDYNGPARRVVEPLPTQTTHEGDGLLAPAVDVDDCYFRMLEPHEIKVGMAFAATYQLLGNKREQVRLAGNAVTPPAARDLGCAVVEALLGDIDRSA